MTERVDYGFPSFPFAAGKSFKTPANPHISPQIPFVSFLQSLCPKNVSWAFSAHLSWITLTPVTKECVIVTRVVSLEYTIIYPSFPCTRYTVNFAGSSPMRQRIQRSDWCSQNPPVARRTIDTDTQRARLMVHWTAFLSLCSRRQ